MFSRWIVLPRALPHSSHSLRGSSPGLCTVHLSAKDLSQRHFRAVFVNWGSPDPWGSAVSA
jgi:hypothetical protein